jgi:predicted Zn-dependent protease
LNVTRARIVGSLALVLALLLGVACGGGSSAPKPRKTVLYTEADDQRVGEQQSLQVGGQLGFVDDPELEAYVDGIGKRLARHAPRGRYPYQFKVVDQDAPNAFALPGGYIYVSRGLLILANSEQELAGVLGHEIIHVAARHAAARQALVDGLGAMQFLAGAAIAGFGRDQEREADRVGQGLAGIAGYDPDGLPRFLRQLEFQERLRLGGSRLPGFFDSHPATAERIASASSRARSIAWRPEPTLAAGREGYLRHVDGLTVGAGAREGVFQGDRFLHPELLFTLRFPSGWHMQNTRQAVGALSPRRDAVVMLELQGFGDDPEMAASQFLSSPAAGNVHAETVQPIRIGALPGYRVQGRAHGGAAVPVVFTWIAYRGSIYRITGLSRPPADRFAGTFRAVARSFRPLPPEALAGVRETHVRVVSARDGETLKQISERTGNTWNLQELAVVNGLYADATLASGDLVKVAVAERYGGGPAAGR